MTPGILARIPGAPTSSITGSKEDGHSPIPPEGGMGGSLTVRRAVDANLGSPRGDPRLAYSQCLLRFIHCPRRTRQVIALTRAITFLPCLRTVSKALRSLRRTSCPSRGRMYTVSSLAGTRPPPLKGRGPLQTRAAVTPLTNPCAPTARIA